jgi:RNA polymerase sigma-70 factor (ECF subfamily)
MNATIKSTSAISVSLPCADSIDDFALLQRLHSRDQRAYADLMLKYGGRMLAVAQRLLRNEQDAQDAVQDAFLSAFRSLDQFTGQSQLGTWLHRIVVNAALMKIRSRKRRDECSIEEMLPAFEHDGHRRNPRPAWRDAGDEILERREVRLFVRKKIDQLPEDYRTVLMLRDIEELDTDETANVLGISPGAVKTRLHRARMALRELLDREFFECNN